MASIRKLRNFKGEDELVLLLLSALELATLRQALNGLAKNDQTLVTLGECTLSFETARKESSVDILASGARLHFTDADVEQFVGLLDGLLLGSGPGHQYMDIAWPTHTLMISIGEYPDGFGNDA